MVILIILLSIIALAASIYLVVDTLRVRKSVLNRRKE